MHKPLLAVNDAFSVQIPHCCLGYTDVIRKTATRFCDVEGRGLGTRRDWVELPEDFSVCPARLYLGRDVCYDGFCAPGNQFPVLITKSRPGWLSAGRPGSPVCRLLCFVETSLIGVQLQRNTSAIMNNQCPAATIQRVSKRPQQRCAASLTPCYIATYINRIIIFTISSSVCLSQTV